MSKQSVVIVGASDNPERNCHRALLLLRKHGHEVGPVHPELAVLTIPCFAPITAARRQPTRCVR